jgi:hypothetical protein
MTVGKAMSQALAVMLEGKWILSANLLPVRISGFVAKKI